MASGQKNLKEILAATRQIHISVKGRKTGRAYSYPVWFVLEGRRLYLLPVRGSDTQWYRNLLRSPAIEIAARGATAKLRGAPVTRPAAVKAVIRKFGEKYKARIVRKLYFKFDAAVRVQLAGKAIFAASPLCRERLLPRSTKFQISVTAPQGHRRPSPGQASTSTLNPP